MIRFLCTALAAMSLSASLPAADSPVYELRIYTTNEGKLPNLLARFRDHTCRLFEKHGMTNLGYWVPIKKEDGADNTLIYIISHKDREAAKASWKAFVSDPDWQAAAKASEVEGKILAKAPESIFMLPTAFSPPVKVEAGAGERVFEMRTYHTVEGKLPALHERFTNHTMKLFAKHGMTNLFYFTPTDAEQGASDKLIYFLAHASPEAGLKSFTDFRADPVWIAAKGESEKNGSLTLPQPEGVKSVYLKATDFSPLK
jgi:hypothetical protein